jgi:hypothetical protein
VTIGFQAPAGISATKKRSVFIWPLGIVIIEGANVGMKIHNSNTAVVFIDPQNEVLSETGKSWPLLHENLKENGSDATLVHFGCTCGILAGNSRDGSSVAL